MSQVQGPGREASSELRSIEDLYGPAGRLEALLNAGRGGGSAEGAVLICHPHPLGGGSMHNKVVYHAMKAFQALGLPVLRFNFRGTGKSAGEHDGGRGEVEDVRAALNRLEREFSPPLFFAGFSFGAYVGLQACCGDTRVKSIVALGIPLCVEERRYTYPVLSKCRQPKLFLSGAEDIFAPKAELEALAAGAAPPAQLVLFSGADHFFAGQLEEMQRAIRAWMETQFLLPRTP